MFFVYRALESESGSFFMTTTSQFFCQFINIKRVFSCTKRAFYFISFLHQDTRDVDVRQTTEIPYDMRFEMAIILCLWEEKTGNISLLDD